LEISEVKILIIEDIKQTRALLKHFLRKQGFQTFEALNGEDGLRSLASEMKDIILLDVLMPKMDGLEFLKTIRDHDTWKNIPVIMLSSLGDKNTVSQSAQLGATSFIVKPYQSTVVVEKIKEILNIPA